MLFCFFGVSMSDSSCEFIFVHLENLTGMGSEERELKMCRDIVSTYAIGRECEYKVPIIVTRNMLDYCQKVLSHAIVCPGRMFVEAAMKKRMKKTAGREKGGKIEM